MKGLELSQCFFEEIAVPLFEKDFPELLDTAAFGLVGEGSECFGFDDGLSRDHDFGAGFCIWLPRSEWETRLACAERLIERLPVLYRDYPVRMFKNLRMGRLGPLSFEAFFENFIGRSKMPSEWWEWINIPEHFLAVCTNGKIFLDKTRRFSAMRQHLLNFYPEDVRLKKIAARCAVMGQTGQYNALRSMQRDEYGAVLFSVSRFCDAAVSLAFLLNKAYMPYYKWAHHAVKALPVLGSTVYAAVEQLCRTALSQPQSIDSVFELIETLCGEVRMELNRQGLSQSTDNWLMPHAYEIQSRISVPELKKLSVLQDTTQYAVTH